MIKRWLFYLVLMAFVSHNIVFLFQILLGTQPRINVACPLAISFINTPLLFDRDELFFNTQVYNLSYPDKKVTLTRRDIRPGLFSYFNMLYFAHWGKYHQMPGASAIILSHYFCHENAFMKKLNLVPPISIERKISDSRNLVLVEETIQCQK